MSEGYNGWSNHATWCVNLWLDNEEGTYKYVRELARDAVEEQNEDLIINDETLEDRIQAAKISLSEQIEQFVEDQNPLANEASVFSGLLTSALEDVDYYEIAGHWIDEMKSDFELPPEPVEIKVITAPGTNASDIGSCYCYEGVVWSNSSDNVDSDGCGRLFLTCDDEDIADFVRSELDKDERVSSHD